MSGGFDFSLSEFNRATQAQRQPGSAFKPFVYLSALQHGYTPSSLVYDTPISVDQGQGGTRYRPRNYGGGFIGLATLRSGVERSRNVMTVRLLVEMGLQPIKETAEAFGIYQNMPLYPAMGLGAGETTPLKLTTAYATIANGGYQISPYLIERVQDRDGRSLRQPGVVGPDRADCIPCAVTGWTGQPAPAQPRGQVLDDPIANYQMISILQGVTQRGTAARLAGLGLPLAGKTGTTNDSNDVWFVGFSPRLAVGIYRRLRQAAQPGRWCHRRVDRGADLQRLHPGRAGRARSRRLRRAVRRQLRLCRPPQRLFGGAGRVGRDHGGVPPRHRARPGAGRRHLRRDQPGRPDRHRRALLAE